MEIAGYAAAICVGLVLGIMGAGGAILTVPILVYLFNIEPVTATSYSLFIVGTTTLVGSVSYIKQKVLDLKTPLFFAIPCIISMFVTRKLFLPAIPDNIMQIGSITLTKNLLVLIFFALFMIMSSISMIRGGLKNEEKQNKLSTSELIQLILYGIIVGLITGFVGAGGGFLIIPVLVIFAHLPVKKAIGTSLIIIAGNSLTGFAGDLSAGYIIDWELIAFFLLFAVIGIFAGTYIVKHISSLKLKKSFGWFVLAMGVYIITRELFFKF